MRVVGGVDALDWDSYPSSGGAVSADVPICESVQVEGGAVVELIRIGGSEPSTWEYLAVRYEEHELPRVRRRTRLTSYVRRSA